MKKTFLAILLSSFSYFSYADGVVMLPPPSINNINPALNPALIGTNSSVPSSAITNSVPNINKAPPIFQPPIYNEETGSSDDSNFSVDKKDMNYIYSSAEKKTLTCQEEVLALSKNLNILNSKEETVKSLVGSNYWKSLNNTEKSQNIKILAEIYKMPNVKIENAKKSIISKYALDCKNKLINSEQ